VNSLPVFEHLLGVDLDTLSETSANMLCKYYILSIYNFASALN
jgi:hypothetical protein